MYLYIPEGQCLAPPRSASLKDKVQGWKHDDIIQYLPSILQNWGNFPKIKYLRFYARHAPYGFSKYFFFFRKKESNFKNSGIGHLKLYMPEAQVWNQCNPCEICGRQRGSGTGSFQISLFTSVNYHYANFLNSPTYKPFHSHSTKHLSHMVPQQ